MDNLRELIATSSTFVVPVIIVAFILYGLIRRVSVYEEFVEGAKEGFTTAIRILPYVVAMLVAVGMFKASGGLEMLQGWMQPLLSRVGFPPELLPIAIVRPMTSSGSTGLLADLAKQLGSDSPIVKMGATLYGSTETTFYVLAVYFGAVNVKKTRHALPAGLLADLFGTLFSVYVIRLLFHG